MGLRSEIIDWLRDYKWKNFFIPPQAPQILGRRKGSVAILTVPARVRRLPLPTPRSGVGRGSITPPGLQQSKA